MKMTTLSRSLKNPFHARLIIYPVLFIMIIACSHFGFKEFKHTLTSDISSLFYFQPICFQYPKFQNVFSRTPEVWTRNRTVCGVCDCPNCTKTNLRTPFGSTPVYVYDPKDDLWVSGDVLQKGMFDKEKIIHLLHILKSDPDLNVIDIGANIGVFSLTAAKFGRKVIAIEALDTNVQRLCFSVRDGGFADNISIIYNAAADKSGQTVSLGVHKYNIGGTFVNSEDVRKMKESFHANLQGNYGTAVGTITLDNLLELREMQNFKKVVIKIDVEGYEDKVLFGAKALFDTIDVRAVFMEWVFHTNNTSGEKIIDFMTERKYKPYVENGTILLDHKDNKTWPLDVLWMKSRHR